MIELIFAIIAVAFFMAVMLYVKTTRRLKRAKSPVKTCGESSQCCSGRK
ncbi:MAG: hypothetical protein KAG61_10700 [Bacteriovoracaceae bacterium]|nr:hypothetical protein [Bacteriovoracaceae bacterium]